MSMKSTASIHIPNKRQNHKWSSLSIHNDRRPNSDIKRSNTNINKKLTKLNKYGCLTSYYKFMNKPIVWKKLHHKNKVYIKNRHPGKASFKQISINSNNKQKMIDKYGSKVIGIHTNKRNHHQYLLVDSLHKYLKHLDYKNTRVGIISIGDSKFRDKFENKLKKQGKSLKQCRRIETKALLQYMEGFNNRNHNLKIGHFAIHNDETFIHAHVEFYHLARTAKGKPSYSISTAIKSEYPLQPKNNLAMKAFRHTEDNEMISSLAWSAQLGLTLYRKGHHKDKQTRYNHSLANKYSSVASYVSSKSKPMYSQAHSFAISFASSANSVKSSLSSVSSSNALVTKSNHSDLVTIHKFNKNLKSKKEEGQLTDNLITANKSILSRLYKRERLVRNEIKRQMSRFKHWVKLHYDKITNELLARKQKRIQAHMKSFNHEPNHRNQLARQHQLNQQRNLRRLKAIKESRGLSR